MSYLIGTASEVKKELDFQDIGQLENVYIRAILKTKSGKSVMLVEITKPQNDD